jgi:hypothetical protein
MGSASPKRHYLTFDLKREGRHGDRPTTEGLPRIVSEITGKKPDRGHKVAGPWIWQEWQGDHLAKTTTGIRNLREVHSLLLEEPDFPRLRDACADPHHGLERVAVDLRLRPTDYWNPSTATRPLFGNRASALRLMGLPKPDVERDNCRDVNIVIVDQGLDRRVVEAWGGAFAGGWQLQPSQAPGETRGGHGSMLARNVLSAAPGATILDLPLIPPTISNIPAFLCDAHAAFEDLLVTIRRLGDQRDERWKRPWVILNAWAVFNNGNEHKTDALAKDYNYTYNPNHPLNEIIGQMAIEHDLVFAAGNCGQFCPDGRCGADNVGPGHSILGANSHPDVLTVGAVRTDGLWLGYSSQGPGTLTPAKPDICAPSQFSEDDDEGLGNTGTSAASALVAGLVARHRSKLGNSTTPQKLKQMVINSAMKMADDDRNRFGRGVVRWS